MMEITIIGDDNKKSFEHMTGEVAPGQGALGVIVDGEAAGAGVFSLEDNIAVIDSIYVLEPFRRKKVASFLLGDVCETFRESGAGSILAYYQENEELTLFLENAGFTCIQTDPVNSFLARNLLGTKQAVKFFESKIPEGIVRVSELKKTERNKLEKMLTDAGYDGTGILEECDPKISYAYMKDNNPAGVITSRMTGEDFYVTFFYSGLQKNMETFSALMISFVKLLFSEASDNARVYYIGQNPGITEMLDKLLPGKRAPRSEAATWSAFKSLSENAPVPTE